MTVTNDVEEDIDVLDGVEMYRIAPIDRIDPFLMTVVSSSDLWMFVSSTGGLTAGRVEPQNCIFPYETDDRLHHLSGRVGPVTVLRVRTPDATTRWEPFTGDDPHTRRSLRKSLLGNAVVFEEQHLELGLTMRYRWAPSDRFGWVRTASLVNHDGHQPVTVEILDGLLDVMPWGIGVPFQQQMSNLANAYRRSEITEAGIGIFTLEALIVDVPEPAEALRATTVWSTGLGDTSTSLDPRGHRSSTGCSIHEIVAEDRPPRLVPGRCHRRSRPRAVPTMARRRRRGPEPCRHRSAHPRARNER